MKRAGEGDAATRPRCHAKSSLRRALCAALLVAAATACSRGGAAGAPAAAAAIPVVIAAVERRPMPRSVHAIGNVLASATVAVKARVDGELTAVRFKEGDFVRQGEPLFDIDPRSMQAALAQAQANLARDRALAAHAATQDRRYAELRDQGFISPDGYAQYRTNDTSARAIVRADEAAVATARLQLDYSHIVSSIDGVAGALLIERGNLVKANDATPLVVINRVMPVYVAFAVPEADLAEIRARMARATLPVAAVPAGAGAVAGTLAFVDNAVDPATGTIRLRATFPNHDRTLWPGEFVRVTLTLAEQPDALVVPAQAVQAGPEGTYVFVSRPDHTAELRPVTVDRTVGTESVIAKGLAAGEQVVIDGQSRLVPGAHVTVAAAREGTG
jgi:multidrug efflux system membrane fusion protein